MELKEHPAGKNALLEKTREEGAERAAHDPAPKAPPKSLLWCHSRVKKIDFPNILKSVGEWKGSRRPESEPVGVLYPPVMRICKGIYQKRFLIFATAKGMC